VNGTLEGEELEQFERHFSDCLRCQREVREMHGVQRVCIGAKGTQEFSDSFERLRKKLVAQTTVPPHRSWLARLSQAWQGIAPRLRWTTAGQMLLLLGMGGLLFGGQPPAAGYRTLGDGEPAALAPVGVAEHQLVVVFDPQLSEARMRVLLRASGARIVDGPSDAGAYVLSLSADRVATAQAALRAAPGVVLVERLDPAAGH
jgi:hypothetical protein